MINYSIHKEGFKMLLVCGLILLVINLTLDYFLPKSIWLLLAELFSGVAILFLIFFFRIPRKRIAIQNDQFVIAPASGKIVAIEEVFEPEYFQDKRIQVSIFMSPTNVHVNLNPISGIVKYTKYHPGKYLVAWHPKSSTKNERYTTVIGHKEHDTDILVRQIAGKVARKIKNYLDEGEQVLQGKELGFIKLGSRVDLFLPVGTKINVKLKEKVVGGKTILAEMLPGEEEA